LIRVLIARREGRSVVGSADGLGQRPAHLRRNPIQGVLREAERADLRDAFFDLNSYWSLLSKAHSENNGVFRDGRGGAAARMAGGGKGYSDRRIVRSDGSRSEYDNDDCRARETHAISLPIGSVRHPAVIRR
jgi:hypothetical protein